jgi:hypothetical protein
MGNVYKDVVNASEVLKGAVGCPNIVLVDVLPARSTCHIATVRRVAQNVRRSTTGQNKMETKVREILPESTVMSPAQCGGTCVQGSEHTSAPQVATPRATC